MSTTPLADLLRVRLANTDKLFHRSTFQHSCPLASHHRSDLYYFPPRNLDTQPRALWVYLPGNPGLLEYYDSFLQTLYTLIPSHIGILAIGQAGHAPHLPPIPSGMNPVELPGQVEAKLEILDEVWRILGKDVNVGISGHSVGSWMSIQILEQRPQISSAMLLFPTLSHIAQSPNGKQLQPIFRSPLIYILPRASLLTKLIPRGLLSYVLPAPTIALVQSFHVIRAALILGRSEMDLVQEPDLAFLKANRHRIWGYWGESDGWVGVGHGNEIRDVLEQTITEVQVEPQETLDQKIWHGVESIPHAFCLAHGEIIARKVAPWLETAFEKK
ncbi:Uncharacterized conserved protein [Phaffia rhodozyma]|uniref:Uncharacterized conserved protein n=1 Tax=Phaffia rhodozyma TaxID=264483 RepID=A0A0F7SMP9_PHARH|nr:Uncharacterized conserved protein [Phaffia rhodozyma]